MLGLWFIFAGMMLFSLALLLRPLLQGKAVPARPAGAHDLEVYRDQMRELERDRARALIGEAEAKAARAEIERRALAAGEASSGATAMPKPLPRLALGVALTIPLAAGILYFTLGAPEMASPRDPSQANGSDTDAGPAARAQMIGGMVARLEDRLEANPEDPAGWRMLGRSYLVLGRAEDAVRAYGRAATLAPEDAAVLTDYATAMIVATPAPARPPDRAVPVLRQILVLQPGHPLALYFLGIDAARSGDDAWARQRFETLLEGLPAEHELRADIEARLRALDPE